MNEEGRNDETSDDGMNNELRQLFGLPTMSLDIPFLRNFLLEAHVLSLAPSLNHLFFAPPVLCAACSLRRLFFELLPLFLCFLRFFHLFPFPLLLCLLLLLL